MSLTVDSNVKKWGNGSAVRLTKELLAVAGFDDTEAIEITAELNMLVIKKKKRKTLEELFEGYEGFYEPTEEDSAWLNMKPAGDEIKW